MTRSFLRLFLVTVYGAVVAGCSGGAAIPAPSVADASAASAPLPDIRFRRGETPLAASALVDSIGLNTDTPANYGRSDFSTGVALLRSLGVRHFREGILNADPAYDAALLHMLQATGGRLDGITDCAGIAYSAASPTSARHIEDFQAAIGGLMELVEGPNEVDDRKDATWSADTKRCLPALRSALPLPFVAPSLANPQSDAASLGDVSDGVSYGNVHRYFGGHNPGTTGWGGTFACGTYGALSWALCEAGVNSGSLPVLVTESGYNSQTEVDEATQAKYLSRLVFVNLKAGISRTYLFNFKDDPSHGTFGADGIVRANDAPKPAYVALRSVIGHFADAAASTSRQESPLAYSLSNRGLDHMLFRKKDGQFILALWNETSSWDADSKTKIVVTPQRETIALPFAPAKTSAVTLDDAGAFTSTAVVVAGRTASLLVDDHVTLVDFTAP